MREFLIHRILDLILGHMFQGNSAGNTASVDLNRERLSLHRGSVLSKDLKSSILITISPSVFLTQHLNTPDDKIMRIMRI